MLQEAAQRSVNLPIGEVFYLIEQGFTPAVNKYPASQWIDSPANEHIMDKYSRYKKMVGPEEFQTLATMISYLRLTQPVCSNCGCLENLKICQKCKLTFYCSHECQRVHWVDHRNWCCRRFRAVRDIGFASIVLFDKSLGV